MLRLFCAARRCAVLCCVACAGLGCMHAESFAGTRARNDLEFLGHTRSATRHVPSEKFQLEGHWQRLSHRTPVSLSRAFERAVVPTCHPAHRQGGDFRPKPALVRLIRFREICEDRSGQSVLASNETLKQTENYHARKVKGGFVSDDWLHRHLHARDLDF